MTSPLATAFVLIRPTTTGFGPTLKRDLDGAAGADGTASQAGHVGIIVGPGTMVNAYGTGYGTIFSPFTTSGASGGFGIPPTGFDKGGWLKPGLSLAYNGTGRPEQVMPAGRGGGATVTYNINVNTLPGGEREAGRKIVECIRQFESGSGASWRNRG